MMQLDRANLIQLYKNDEMVCLPFAHFELIKQKQLNEAINAKGHNQKKVLVIVNHSIDDLNSADNVLLFNILKAINLTIEDVTLVAFTGLPFKLLLKAFEFDKCIVMGLKPPQLGLQIVGKPYQIFNFMDTFLLLSHSAELLKKHKDYKAALWVALQKMFPIT